MLLPRQYEKVWAKLDQIEITYESLIFPRIREISSELFVCDDHFREKPEGDYRPVKKGDVWGGSGKSGWFSGEITVLPEEAGQKLYLEAETGAIEAMLFLDGKPKGVYAHKIVEHNRGNHHMLYIGTRTANETIPFAIEGYCWHNGVGTQPFAIPDLGDKTSEYDGIWLCRVNETVKDFVFNLKILNQLRRFAKDDFRKAQVSKCLWDVFELVPQKPEEVSEDCWMNALKLANERMQTELNVKNAPGGPSAGLIGHSHMDTAWQWTIDETIRKCARTYSNALNLMDEYDDYLFFQSSAYHGELMKQHYPSIYEDMKRRVAEGRYEPNGGAWIECDCNLVSGESMIRQFLWGQRWTKENFDYTSDVFWLPDTFGYSAAIPQILKGCGIRYFLTTKLTWNDTNEFPYDTFRWRGLDGSQVFVHFNDIHCKPDPEHIIGNVYGHTKLKMVNQDHLISYGFGDGGGGPSYDMVEMAERVKDIQGCPTARHTTVSIFMQKLEQEANAPLYAGELYLEGHRGTLTSFHDIKRNNRKAEIALHDLEFASSMQLLAGKEVPSCNDCYETLLVNQFHDILPGTCIPEVNRRSIREMKEMIGEANSRFETTLSSQTDADSSISLVNTLPWTRSWAYVPAEHGVIRDLPCQPTAGLDGVRRLYVTGLCAEGQNAVSLRLSEEQTDNCAASPFVYENNRISSPFYEMEFDENGYISSLYDKTAGRELAQKDKAPLNCFYLPEDIPATWDNWDIDADVIESMCPVTVRFERELVENGPLLCRIRSRFYLTDRTTLDQDIILYADRRQIDFETTVDWHEKHHLLKAGFDMDINAASAKNEIQFGYMERSCFKNNSYEKAMFEVLNHKYTDISECHFGAALLNDCKYGISINGTQAALTLLKSGTHPDPSGDEGVHSFTYSLVTHDGFNWENVIRPAYELNYPLRAVQGSAALVQPVLECDRKNVIAETIKPAEDKNGLIVRLYESERTGGRVRISLKVPAKKVFLTNLLEENQEELEVTDGTIGLSVRAFEIVTLRIVM